MAPAAARVHQRGGFGFRLVSDRKQRPNIFTAKKEFRASPVLNATYDKALSPAAERLFFDALDVDSFCRRLAHLISSGT